MSSTTIFQAIGSFCQDVLFMPFEMIGNYFNYTLLVVGFIGLFYWLNLQRKFNQQAKNNPDQLK